MIILDHKLSIYMMKQDNNGRDLSYINAKAKKLLTSVFGGLTITEAAGTWYNDDGRLYVDKSYVFTCNYSKKLYPDQVKVFIDVIKDELRKGKQQAVSVMIDDTLCIVEAGDLNELKDILPTR